MMRKLILMMFLFGDPSVVLRTGQIDRRKRFDRRDQDQYSILGSNGNF